MTTHNINRNISTAEVKTELTEEELAKVSGGATDKASVKFFQNCVSGAHYKTVTLQM
jgi:bacteriocin-like protein